jgi:8-oxo-dGTP pyrophosphatase MutT (NUDIX family)
MSDYIRRIRSKVGQEQLILPSAAAIIFNDNYQLLLGFHRGIGKWSTPGGMVEPGELPADAAKRETWEETGLIVEPIEIIAVQGGPLYQIEYVHGDCVAYTSTWFRCEIRSGDLMESNSEMAELKFFSHNQAQKLDLAHVLSSNLDLIFEPRDGVYFSPATWAPE